MLRLSANLGFLWTDRPLPDAIRAAARAGFDAVECHWPYETDAAELRHALTETNLPMISLNTSRGSRPDDFGLAALPDRMDEARAAIDEAFAYGSAIGAAFVHVLAGRAEGPEAAEAFEANLGHACDLAAEKAMTVLIEPLNPRDAPGYFLGDFATAVAIVRKIGRPQLKILFDCYHLQITGGDLICRFADNRELIGHVQFAGVPGRDEPDRGEVAYERLLPNLAGLGYAGCFGAEYRPDGATEASLSWMKMFR
ncbi:isomerase [Jiella endophytica]|uniref:Isomerase n=1 Tax=Jiella endophytica TaxID=2558362 RepID=A0A4Y8RT32_9HYPH|nr:TIM barrel protein [Jiella endophytica]TFF27469.1 isomerase [Jiella endophytica]